MIPEPIQVCPVSWPWTPRQGHPQNPMKSTNSFGASSNDSGKKSKPWKPPFFHRRTRRRRNVRLFSNFTNTPDFPTENQNSIALHLTNSDSSRKLAPNVARWRTGERIDQSTDRRLEKNAPIRAFIDHIEKTEFHGKVELTVQAGKVIRWEEKTMHLADEYLKHS